MIVGLLLDTVYILSTFDASNGNRTVVSSLNALSQMLTQKPSEKAWKAGPLKKRSPYLPCFHPSE